MAVAGQQETLAKHEKPRRSGVVLRVFGKLCGNLSAMPPVADTG